MAYGDVQYGAGVYKGIVAVEASPTGFPYDLYSDDGRICLVFGLEQEHGGGWSERNGDAWVWPTSPASITQVFDERDQLFTLGLCGRDGLFYIVNPIDGVGIDAPYRDKVDPLINDSGSDIEWDVTFGEVHGEMRHYACYNLEQHVMFRPVRSGVHGTTGYNAAGLPNGFEVDVSISQDALPAVVSNLENIAINEDIVHERQVDGKSHQSSLHGNRAAFKLISFEQYCKVYDKPDSHNDGGGGQAGEQYEKVLSAPRVWLARGRMLLNRATGRVYTGSASFAIGPDGRSDGAVTLGAALDLANGAVAAGTLMLWHEAGYTISGVTLVELSEEYRTGDFRFSYAAGAIPANLELPVGVVADVRLYSADISTAVLNYYCDNVLNHGGDIFLP